MYDAVEEELGVKDLSSQAQNIPAALIQVELLKSKEELVRRVEDQKLVRNAFAFNSKSASLRITTISEQSRSSEVVEADNFMNYLLQLENDFFARDLMIDFVECYLLLKRAADSVRYYHKKVRPGVYHREYILIRLNQMSFLSLHSLFPQAKNIADEVQRLSRPSPADARMSSASTHTWSIEKLHSDIFRKKAEQRVLFSSLLCFYEQVDHQKTMHIAQKALITAVEIVALSRVLAYSYVLKYVERAKTLGGHRKSANYQALAHHFSSLAAIFDLLALSIADISAEPDQNMESYRMSVAEALTQEGFSFARSTDLSLIAREALLDRSPLKQATIVALLRFNFAKLSAKPVRRAEVGELAFLEKTAYIILPLYVLATFAKAREQEALSAKSFHRSLVDYADASGHPLPSELLLTKAVQICYLFLPETFPFVAQIFAIFRRLELNRSRIIPECAEDPREFVYLKGYFGGFRNQSIVPVLLNLSSYSLSSLFESGSEKRPLRVASKCSIEEKVAETPNAGERETRSPPRFQVKSVTRRPASSKLKYASTRATSTAESGIETEAPQNSSHPIIESRLSTEKALGRLQGRRASSTHTRKQICVRKIFLTEESSFMSPIANKRSDVPSAHHAPQLADRRSHQTSPTATLLKQKRGCIKTSGTSHKPRLQKMIVDSPLFHSGKEAQIARVLPLSLFTPAKISKLFFN